MIQIIVKVCVSIPLVLLAVWLLHRVWIMDIDVAKLFSPKFYIESSKKQIEEKLSAIPQREPGCLYQDGEKVAKVEGVEIDQRSGLCAIKKMYQADRFDFDKSFEYQNWVFKFKSAELMYGFNPAFPNDGKTILDIKCEIIGRR